MLKLKLLLRLAYLASASTFILAIACALGFVLRWTDSSWLHSLSDNAGNVGFGAVVAAGVCYVTLFKARDLAFDISEQQRAAKAASQPEVSASEPATEGQSAPDA